MTLDSRKENICQSFQKRVEAELEKLRAQLAKFQH